jgi:hypothetical protein
MRRAMIVVVGTAAGLGLAACGGGGSDEQGSAKLARAEIVAKADAICRAGEKAVSAIDAPADLSDAKAAAAYFEKVAPLNDKQTDELAALVPADAVKADWQPVIDAQNEGNELLKRLRDKAKAADASGLEDLKTFATVTGEFGAAARKLGAKACAGEPAAAGAVAASTTGTTTTAAATSGSAGAPGVISVDYDAPRDDAAAFAKEILHLGGTDGVADGFTKSFALPRDVTIHVVNGLVGPNYDPASKTITLSYGFVNYTATVLKRNFPELRRDDEEFGKQLAAVDAFILIHEFGHTFIDVFELPVLGREEDAADAVATVFLTRDVDNGAEYAFDAARFFNALSGRQRNLAPQDFFDEHSLDKQRAYSIVCWIAGSSEASYRDVARRGLLSDERQRRCPAEYEQKVSAVQKLLSPHLRS